MTLTLTLSLSLTLSLALSPTLRLSLALTRRPALLHVRLALLQLWHAAADLGGPFRGKWSYST